MTYILSLRGSRMRARDQANGELPGNGEAPDNVNVNDVGVAKCGRKRGNEAGRRAAPVTAASTMPSAGPAATAGRKVDMSAWALTMRNFAGSALD
jgi:hypothetical protein